ncbi:GNAT family N-acetyltransferase [Streptomyces triculaminicus]|uniref:GNAT family N-acetyltransferase n=2 Tax=Streptomyces TaxID=1883 RepID=A0A939JV15_9ACTN|nr:GNAT family N-acetyltransferase [Streptomyces triculaminicus]QSY52745.1 GNAT family N-acetyltransferase [Streptomyces griseocarneus]
MNDLTVRPGRPDELAAVAELRWRWVRETYGTPDVVLDEFVPRFVAWAQENEPTHRCMVMVRGDVVIGMAWLAITRRVPHPRSFERMSGDVQCVYVVPDERDRGLGGELIEAVLAWASDLGLERVTVHSSDRAVSAYSRRGFTVSPRLLQVEMGQGSTGESA